MKPLVPSQLLAVLLALPLAACGGGDGDESGPLAKQVFAAAEDQPLVVVLAMPTVFAGGTWTIATPPVHGTATLEEASGTLRYQPQANFHGTDTLAVRLVKGGRTAHGEVELQVAPVADPATLLLPQPRAELAGGRTGTMVISVIDPDGPPTVAVVQTGGTVVLSGLAYGVYGVTATAPPVTRVEQAQLTLTVTDPEAPVGPWIVDVEVLPASADGAFLTVRGAPASAAMHWVIVSDGYRDDERAKFRNDAQRVIDFLYGPAGGQASGYGTLAPLASGWNVHLLWAPSAQSGVDVPSERIFVDTAFGSTLDCAGIGRLLCADWGAVSSALQAVAPWHDLALVLVNTERYGGAGGVISTATNHDASGDLVLHEMGHSHAKLGDEYVDALINRGPPDESWFANLTTQPVATSVKWARWIADLGAIPTAPGQSGVGHFEGGHYMASGVWRPSFDSAMRTLGVPLDAVGAEAWALQTYARAAAIVEAAPAPGVVPATANESVTFKVRTLLDAPHQSLRWTVDGVTVPAWDDLREVAITAPPGSGTRVVTVAPRDATGLIHPTVTGGAHDAPTAWIITVP